MRSHYCGELNTTHVGEQVELCGWVHRRRDHGGVIFLDIRDRAGIIQVVYDPDTVDSFATADKVRNEYVLRMTGLVRLRPEGTVNPDMATGEVEVLGVERKYEHNNIWKLHGTDATDVGDSGSAIDQYYVG